VLTAEISAKNFAEYGIN